MPNVSSMSRQKSWRDQRRPVSVLAEMALRREKVVQRLVEIREANALTQEQAAARVGVTLRQWQRWESGASMPYPKNLDAVASKFGLSIQEFFDDDAPPASRDGATLADILMRLDRLEYVIEAIADHLGVSPVDQPAGAVLSHARAERQRQSEPTRSDQPEASEGPGKRRRQPA